MKSIYDIINESILDDIDDIMNVTDNIVSKGWFEENATGKFKAKISKKGITKITGDVIIKGYEGETFPDLNIDEFNGSLTIEKCPNLVSMEGLFKQYFYKIYGNLIINNCPKLTKLACPNTVEGNFQLVGNSSLKSLEGAPEMVTDEVYIMKNGKKFTEDQIKKHIPYIGDFICCSEESEEVDITESEEVDEAFGNPYLMLLAKQLKESGLSFKEIFNKYGSHVSWDQVDSSHITNYNWRYKSPSDKDLKAARAIISGKSFGYIITYRYEDNKLKFIRAIDGHKSTIVFGGKYARWYQVKSTELIDMICGRGYSYPKCDGMIIIHAMKDLDNWEKRNERGQARSGMVENTPEYYRQVARENMERYKKIVAQNRANRKSGDVERVQKKVNEFLQKIMQASANVMKNPTKYTDNLYRLEILNEYAYDKVSYDRGRTYGSDGVLVLFNRYMDSWTRTATGKTTYYSGDVQKLLQSIEERIDKIISKAQDYLNSFDVK